MTNEEIIEGNRLIAEFMGARFIDEYTFVFDDMTRDRGVIKYHSDWNWLMTAVEKIGQIIEMQYYQNIFCYLDVKFTPRTENRMARNIETAWQAVVEFIKWYNSNTPNP